MTSPIIKITTDEADRKAYATISSEGTWPAFDDVLSAAKAENASFWINEPAITKALEKQVFDAPLEIGQIKDGRVLVTVEPGEIEAYMTIEPAYGGREMVFTDAEQALKEKSVLHGINNEAIGQAFSDRSFGKRFRVAAGKNATNGTDAYIEYFFRTDWVLKPKENTDDTRIDYRDVESVTSVRSGAVIAKKTPSTPGENGITVTGKTIRATPGKDTRLSPGKNTKLSEDGLELISEIDGQPVKLDKVSVEPIITIDGDVDFSTGNVNFAGSVKVTGNVISGFSVKASANIQIDGVVEDSQIEAGGDVLIRGGIRGRESRTVKAGGSVSALFIEQAFVEAGHSIVAQEVLHSELVSGDQVIVTSGKGLISGGRVTAMNLIDACVVGSRSDIRTELSVGFNPQQKAQLDALKEKKTKFETTLTEMEAGISTLERYKEEGSALWQRHEQTYQKLIDTRQQLQEGLERAIYEIGIIEERLVRADNAHIKISGTLYPNALLRMGNLRFQNETELVAVAFHVDEGEIKPIPYSL